MWDSLAAAAAPGETTDQELGSMCLLILKIVNQHRIDRTPVPDEMLEHVRTIATLERLPEEARRTAETTLELLAATRTGTPSA